VYLNLWQNCRILLILTVGGHRTKKFERGLPQLLHTELHWLDVPQRVMYKLSVMMYSCQHGQAPQYLLDVCQPVSDVTSRLHIRSAEYICPAGFLCDWPVGVEFATGLSERPGSQQRHFLQTPKYVSLCDVLIHIAHYRFYDDALCKSTFYLLYLGVLCWQEHNLWSSLSGLALFCLRGRCTPHTSI